MFKKTIATLGCAVFLMSSIVTPVNAQGEEIESNSISSKVERTAPINFFEKIFKSSSAEYSNTHSTVKLSNLGGSQYAVSAKSMARDQDGMPFNIDKIYVKGSLYTKVDEDIIYKVGKSTTETNSSDVLAEKVGGIDKNYYMAQGNHTYEHSGFKTIIHTTTDYK